jgi:hypothetical protein
MVAALKPLLLWFAETAWDPLTTIGAGLVAAAAPLVLVSKQVLTGAERSKVRAPDFKVVGTPVAEAAPSTPIRIVAQPAPAGQHWQRLTNLIAADITGARTARDMQAAARVQLDAADFTLSQIMQDLAQVMPGLSMSEAARPATESIDGRRLAA